MSSLLRRKLSTRQPGTATPLFYNNLPTQWALSLDERTGGAGWRCWGSEGLGLGVRTGQGEDSAALSVCHFLESSGRAPLRRQSKGLCVRHFECRLCYTVHGSPGVQRERVIYFVDIMNVWFVFGSSRTRMFSLISPHRGRAVGFYFGRMETMGSITL